MTTGFQRSRRRFLTGLGTAAAAVTAASYPVFVYGQEDRRLQAARQKGRVVWYTAAFPTDMREAIEKRFQERTGIRVTTYAGGGGQVVGRLRTERQTGARNVDVIDLGDMDVVNGLVKEGLYRPFSPAGADIQGALCSKDPKNHFFGFYSWVLVLEYNTNILGADAVPKSFDDLIDERYKGKIVVADPARSTAGLGLIKAMVTAKGWEWVERFVKNDPLVMAITSGIQPAVIKGERPIAVMTSQFVSKTMQDKGPIALTSNEFLFASPDVVGVLKDGPNPEGAEIFVEFLLSKEAQEIVRAHGAYSCRPDVAPPFGLPALKEARLRYPLAPTINLESREIAERFHKLLRATK